MCKVLCLVDPDERLASELRLEFAKDVKGDLVSRQLHFILGIADMVRTRPGTGIGRGRSE